MSVHDGLDVFHCHPLIDGQDAFMDHIRSVRAKDMDTQKFVIHVRNDFNQTVRFTEREGFPVGSHHKLICFILDAFCLKFFLGSSDGGDFRQGKNTVWYRNMFHRLAFHNVLRDRNTLVFGSVSQQGNAIDVADGINALGGSHQVMVNLDGALYQFNAGFFESKPLRNRFPAQSDQDMLCFHFIVLAILIKVNFKALFRLFDFFGVVFSLTSMPCFL